MVIRKFSADDGGHTPGGGVIQKNFIGHFYAQNAVPGLYTRAETEDCRKNCFLICSQRRGVIPRGVIHQALQYRMSIKKKYRETLIT